MKGSSRFEPLVSRIIGQLSIVVCLQNWALRRKTYTVRMEDDAEQELWPIQTFGMKVLRLI